MRTIGMSDYTVGEDCFDELSGALAEYGAKKVAIIGGKRALAAALPGIEAALAGTDVEILETRVYGTNSTRANIAKVVNSPACQEADVLIACGGGKALDTVKTACPPQLLSLGTRQQLYLALRVALLITAENVGRSLPILCDDILVNFDDERRREAIKVIVELSRYRQVILFTCHPSVAALVRECDCSCNFFEL